MVMYCWQVKRVLNYCFCVSLPYMWELMAVMLVLILPVGGSLVLGGGGYEGMKTT